MTREKKTQGAVSPEALLEQAIIPIWEQPYKTPHNWMWVKQGSISTFLNGRAYKQTELLKDETLTPILRVGNLFTNGSWYYSNLSLEENKYIDRDDLIYAWSASFGPFIWQGGKVIYHYHIWKILVSEVLDKKYYYYWLMHDTERLKRSGHGIGMLHITKDMMENAAMPLPPMVEQRRIVDRVESLFAKLDETKEKAQSVLDSFETRKAAILHKAFVGELTREWRLQNITDDSHLQTLSHGDYLRQDELPCELPTNWKWIHMGAIGYTNIGLTYKPADVSSDGTIVLRSSNIQNGQMDYDDIVRVTIDIPSNKMCQKGDLLICARNGSKALVGKTAIVDKDGMSFGAFMAVFRSKYNPFIYYFLNSPFFRNLIDKDVGTSTINQVTQAIIKELAFPFAPENEQKEIVCILDSLLAKERQAKDAAEAVLKKIDLLKKSILARAFRGELGTNDPTEESAIELLKVTLNAGRVVPQKRKAKSLPKELKRELRSNLEEKIIKLFFQKDTVDISMEEIMMVSSQTFEVIESLRELERRNILKKQNSGHYKLMR